MSWFTRIDRFSDTHLCYSQEDSDSCGLASTKMIVFKMNKLRPGHDATTTEKNVENIYKRYDSTAVNVGKEGVFFHMMHKVLNDLNIGTWKHAKPATTDIPALLLDKLKPDLLGAGLANTVMRGNPIMLNIVWGGTGQHAVVLDTITKIPLSDTYYAAICDPADGDVHITPFEKGAAIKYKGQRVTWSINFGGSADHNYGKGVGSDGVINQIIYCETPP
jgi:hypothetical protein